jgi:Alpha-amylase, domain C
MHTRLLARPYSNHPFPSLHSLPISDTLYAHPPPFDPRLSSTLPYHLRSRIHSTDENPQFQRNAHTVSKAPLLALLINVGNTSISTWGAQNAGYSANENLMKVLTCTKMQADGKGGVSANTGTGQPRVRTPFPCFFLFPFPLSVLGR